MKLKFAMFFLFSVLFTGTALSNTDMKGQVSELWVNDHGRDNIAFIAVGKTYTSSCSEASSRYLIMDLSKNGMKEAFSIALAAYMSGVEITIGSVGGCIGANNPEELKYINLIK